MDFNNPIITDSPQETARIGQEFGNYIKEEGICTVCLYGQLGSGKTTFVQGVAKAFGIVSRLLSPTFIIVRRYNIPQSVGFLYHIDLYRIANEKDLIGLGLQEMLRVKNSIIFIEWAEKMGNLLPQPRIDVYFEVLKDGKHKIWKKKQS